MRRAAVILLALIAGLPAGAAGASISSVELAAVMQGCWFRVNWPERPPGSDPLAYDALQLCLDGGVDGSADYFECHGFANIECREIAATYAFRDEKLWFDYGAEVNDGQLSNCDVTLNSDLRFTLHNCQWIVPTVYSSPIDDIVYEKAR
ncbi:hypothetical protein [Devosia nitrariae]|uniref:Uncharacterized protein n=1 Tax=Devosia nitrariae TaxID=2071872 RepID=A0ABQ5W3V1_9HYPH|nr:hypothetical protein [Devosia nitrariae]GLQ54361.1 hypothetical protein GCM10010862_16200 [Devosia nitrariae]